MRTIEDFLDSLVGVLATEQEPEQPKLPTSWCLGVVYDCSTNYLRICDASSKANGDNLHITTQL